MRLGLVALLSACCAAGASAAVSPARCRVHVGRAVGARAHVSALTADASAEQVKAALAAKEAEYRARQTEEARKQGAGAGEIPPLDSLPVVPFVAADTGLITDVSDPTAKASVYAVSGADGAVQYIGVTRGIRDALRLHLGRCPDECHGVQVHHITKPSRSLLEQVRATWIEQLGSTPPGNADEAATARWEAPLDVRPLMTAEEQEHFEEMSDKGRGASALKAVGRRIEAGKVAALEARGVKEPMRFDPKLKGQGLLDLLPAN